jgi:hypothetical protein
LSDLPYLLGAKTPEEAGVQLSFSTGGEAFSPASGDQFGVPTVIPQGTSHVRFAASGGAGLTGFRITATAQR